MDVLTATGAHNAGIHKVVIKEVHDFGNIIVEEPRTGREFRLYVGNATTKRLMYFAHANGYTEDKQLVGAELSPETATANLYRWRIQRSR